MPPRLLIRARPVGRVWTPLGTDLRRGVYVEDFQCSADSWGPADASFTLKRSSRTSWPDLGFWTPLEVEVENQLVWSGRIISTPGRDADEDTITVNAQGWQYHLDDRPFTQFYVKSALSEWTDIRSNLGCDLTKLTDATKVSNDQTGITITLQGGVAATARPANTGNGVFIDLGTAANSAQVVLNYQHSNNSAQTALIYSMGNSIAAVTAFGVSANIVTLAGGTTPGSFTISTLGLYRYVGIFMFDISGAAQAPAADVWAKLTSINTFAASSFQSAGVSVLTASTVLSTDLAFRLPSLLGTQIGTTSFAIPSLSADQQTSRDVVIAANAFQDWQARVRADRILEYRARPSTAAISLTDQTAFDDLSAGSGDAIYNEVTYTGNGPDGTSVVVTRTSTTAGLPQTVPDRLGVTKGYTIQSSAPLTSAAASQLCDVFLSQRNKTPFKGTIHATSRRSIGINPGGSNCPVYRLLDYPGDLCTFKHLQDPDTGALGRDGRIAKVTYTWSSDSAEVDIDSTAGSFEALLSRLAIATAR